jgi:hypothetical protein
VLSVRYLVPFLTLLFLGDFAASQTVVNSTFIDQSAANYDDPTNWMPAEVPNNTVLKNYNVNISPGFAVEVNVDATISNLTLAGAFTGLNIRGKTFVVNGTTTNQIKSGVINVESSASAAAKFDAGMLSRFSNKALSGNYIISSYGSPATLQFRGADISTLSDGYFGFNGPLARIVDESGNDALLNLARLESGATLSLFDHSLVTNAPFSNEGSLSITQGHTGTTFTSAVSLTNFDPGTRTITNGNFAIGGYDPAIGPAELRFNGADIVNNGSVIQLIGARARIADLAGNDGLRNLARILPNGVLLLSQHDFAITGQFQNDGSLSLLGKSIFTVVGALANFDPTTRTFSGGAFEITDDAQVRFAGADIVHNGAHLSLSDGGIISDLLGNDALRNFNDNLSSGEFIVGNSTQFTAPGDFTNSGKVETIRPLFTPRDFGSPGRFTVPSGFRYTQTAGTTINNGILTAEHIDILAGSVSGGGSFLGDVTVANATIIPSPETIIQGNLTLSAGSHFHFQLYAEPAHEISGKVTLAGTLEVDIPSDRFVSSTQFLTILKSAQPLSGVFSNAPDGARIPTTDGKGSVVVTYGTTAVYVSQYHAEPPPAQLLNISSRAFVSRSDDDPFSDRAVLIGGFIISGTTEPKEVVLRGLGPSLAQFGLGAVLADPVLELHSANGALLVSNDNWKDSQQNEITASGLAPADDREAALRVTLQPGTYTAVLKEKSGFAGTGLVEIYDLSQNSSSKLANLSTRGYTDSSNLLIGGIIAAGDGQANAELVVRAIGPQLRRNGIFNALDDPTLELRDANGVVVAFNDNWVANFQQIPGELQPHFNEESALRLSLPRGNYTALVRAKGNSGGVALVEFYDLRR